MSATKLTAQHTLGARHEHELHELSRAVTRGVRGIVERAQHEGVDVDWSTFEASVVRTSVGAIETSTLRLDVQSTAVCDDCGERAVVRVRDWTRGVHDTWGRDVCQRHLEACYRDAEHDIFGTPVQVTHHYMQTQEV